jgi:ABC-type sugar transport system substrate-binding protein
MDSTYVSAIEIAASILAVFLFPVAFPHYFLGALEHFKHRWQRILFVLFVYVFVCSIVLLLFKLLKVVLPSLEVLVPWCLLPILITLPIPYIRSVREENKTLRQQAQHYQSEHKQALIISDMHSKRVAAFIPRSKQAQDSFWIGFTSDVQYELARSYYSCDVVYLENDYATNEQIMQLKRYNWNSVAGAIVSLSDVNVLPELMDVIRRDGSDGPPIVLHDLAPAVAKKHFDSINAVPHLVCVDNEEGGRIAAEIMLSRLKDRGVRKPYRVLCIAGSAKHPHSALRLEGFIKYFDEIEKSTDYRIDSIDGEWTRKAAAAAFQKYVDERDIRRLSQLHGVFAFNDEMALGVDKILRERNAVGASSIEIVGFDYIDALSHEWRNHEDCLVIGTVNAEMRKQARAAVDLILDLVSKNGSRESVRIIRPSGKMKPGLTL